MNKPSAIDFSVSTALFEKAVRLVASSCSKRRWPFTFFLFFSFPLILNAQSSSLPIIPKSYGWETVSEYNNDRDKIEQVLKWLCKTPLGENVQLRSEANAYVLEWLAGYPGMRMEVETKVIPFLDEDQDLLFPVMHGMALFLLDHPNETDTIKIHAKGLDVLAELCEQSEELSGQHAMKSLLKAHRKGRMKEYVSERLKG